MEQASLDDLWRPSQVEPEGLFDVEPAQVDYWFGLPAFEMRNAQPTRRLTVNFLTDDDVKDFAQRLGARLTPAADSMWWPPQNRLEPKEYVWRGTPSPTRYPVYIPSKGRADVNTTGALLRQAGVSPWWVVEPQEADDYRARYGDQVLVLPFSDLGQGSIPARNWIWEHAKENGHAWHWIIDDNVLGFWRTHANRRLVVEKSSAPLRVVEDLVDRYENLAFAGLAADGFAPDRTQLDPITWNTRVYSVTLTRLGRRLGRRRGVTGARPDRHLPLRRIDDAVAHHHRADTPRRPRTPRRPPAWPALPPFPPEAEAPPGRGRWQGRPRPPDAGEALQRRRGEARQRFPRRHPQTPRDRRDTVEENEGPTGGDVADRMLAIALREQSETVAAQLATMSIAASLREIAGLMREQAPTTPLDVAARHNGTVAGVAGLLWGPNGGTA